MEFIGFPSIETETKLPKMNPNGKWIATEKADGANFGIYLELGNIGGPEWLRWAKRSGFLAPGDKNQFPIDEWFAANLLNLMQTARNIVAYLGEEKMTPGTYAIIYGEFYGGFFPANPAAWQGSKSLPAEMKAYANANDGAKPTTHPFLDYITTNRWCAVRSKYGIIKMGELITAFEADAMEDYLKENSDATTPNLSAKYMRKDLDAFYAGLTDLDESILR